MYLRVDSRMRERSEATRFVSSRLRKPREDVREKEREREHTHQIVFTLAEDEDRVHGE